MGWSDVLFDSKKIQKCLVWQNLDVELMEYSKSDIIIFSRKPMNFGIEALEIYIPNTYVEQSELCIDLYNSETHNQVSKGKYTLGLGQHQLSFAYPF